jgi:hypothetical protein
MLTCGNGVLPDYYENFGVRMGVRTKITERVNAELWEVDITKKTET